MSLLHNIGKYRFFNWWFHALINCIPFGVRSLFSQPRLLIRITLLDGSFEVSAIRNRISGKQTQTAHYSALNFVQTSAKLIQMRKELWGRPTAHLLVPLKQCLILEQKIPHKARNKARDVLDLDFRRIGAFEESEVYTDHFIDESTRNHASAKLIVAKRKLIDPMLDFLADNNFAFKGIGVSDANNIALPVELLPATQRNRFSKDTASWLMQVIAAMLTSVLLLAVFTASIRYWQLSSLNQRLTQNLHQTMQQAKAITRQKNAQNAIFVLSEKLRTKKSSTPLLIHLIEESSRLLPLDAYIQDFTLSNNRLRLTGYAGSAASLIRIFSSSELFEKVEFASPVTLDPGSQKERFEIQIVIASK